MQREVIVAMPATIAPLTGVRSTLIQSSLSTLRKHGHLDRYVELLDPQHRATLLETLAPEWLPIDAASAHYRACDQLQLDARELRAIGEEVGERIQGTFLATLVRKARTLGLNPWIPLAQFPRLLERLMQGGAVSILKTGPKDCTIELRAVTLTEYAYFRTAFCGVVSSGIKLGAGRSVTVQVAYYDTGGQRFTMKCSWV